MAAPNVWTQMNYVPPRGQCNYKQSVLSPKCPCLRFMLHPLKSASSFECDGCNHHASFHSMENKSEDEVCKRWEQEAQEKAGQNDESQQRPKKRVRAIDYPNNPASVAASKMLEAIFGPQAESNKPATKSRGAATNKKTRRAAVGRGKGKVTELVEDEVIDLDG
ncbi:hypothetical protein BDU57DRAFT_507561 [Ampelomyces quisqualis]|uniref:Uncharacterized protein n=1 Tax=Ampelomyces quisqualis TaxID=50730 RepID=A0A6A5QAD8_AMPQU|nr:hypothetical protein BDU57DRAFT_507561 [Ampelomyces quisqualis]